MDANRASGTSLEPIGSDAHIGREAIGADIVDPERMALLAATLDRDWTPRHGLPPLAHFVLFRPQQRQSLIGADGHPRRDADGMMPAVDLPRRMWAGSRMTFHRPLISGQAVTRRSRLVSAEQKVGRSGAMLFCTVEHAISGVDDARPAIVERQDIVYREAHRGAVPAPRPSIALDWQPADATAWRADPVLLFRYSALTFNSHRIHYDRDYATGREGYAGLVVHGPLLATLMLDHLQHTHPARIVSEFAFRAVSPVLDGEDIRIGSLIENDTARLSITGPAGLAMTGTATFAR